MGAGIIILVIDLIKLNSFFFVVLVSTIVPLGYCVALHLKSSLSFSTFSTFLLESVTRADNLSLGLSKMSNEVERFDRFRETGTGKGGTGTYRPKEISQSIQGIQKTVDSETKD